jgi:colanic acid/amylovoran biosynthesis glycosyltransferase
MMSAAAVSTTEEPRMRVAMFVEGFPMVSETFVVNQIVGLIELGHEVDIYSLTAARERAGELHADVQRYDLVSRTTYPGARPRDVGRFVLSGGRAIARLMLHKPSSLAPLLDVRRHREHAWGLRLAQLGAVMLPKRNYDVIHCQFGHVGLASLALLDAGVLDGALVTSFRGSDISRFVLERGADVYAPLFARGDGYFTNCGFFEKRLHGLGCNPAQLEVLYSGIDCGRFVLRERRLDATRPLRLVTVGRLVEKKGISYVIDAVAQLVAAGRRIEYTVIGEGELRAPLEAQIRSLGLEQVVSLPGAGNQQQVINALDHADIFVGPSVRAETGDEDAPINVIKEAMAMGLPVIGTLHGGIPELVQDGVSGLLTPERDAPAIAAAIERLIVEGDRWPQMARAGRAHVEAHFNAVPLRKRLESIYRKAIAHRQSRTSTERQVWPTRQIRSSPS